MVDKPRSTRGVLYPRKENQTTDRALRDKPEQPRSSRRAAVANKCVPYPYSFPEKHALILSML